MDRRAATAVVIGSILAVLFAAIATAGGVELVDGAPSFARNPVVEQPDVQPASVRAESGSVERSPAEVSPILEAIVRSLFYACLALAAAMAAWFAWRHRPTLRLRRPRRRRPVEFDVLVDVAGAVTADAEAQRAALQRGAPRNAIVECWLRLEGAVIAAGVRRDPADTSAELIERVLGSCDVDPAAISRLAVLYREARFSDHSMSEDSRRAAIDALDAVHDGLRPELRTVVTTA